MRWSTLDLVDAGVAGGESDNITAGLNWYLNRNIRLVFNFVNVDGKRPIQKKRTTSGASTSVSRPERSFRSRFSAAISPNSTRRTIDSM